MTENIVTQRTKAPSRSADGSTSAPQAVLEQVLDQPSQFLADDDPFPETAILGDISDPIPGGAISGADEDVQNTCSTPVDSHYDLTGKEHRKLQRRALDATLLTALAYGMTQMLRMANNVILTHLLFPEYFGLVALTTTFTMGMNLLSDVGLLPNIVSSPRGDDPRYLNTAWTIQIVRGLTLWTIAACLAWPLSRFYDHRILMLLPTLSLSMVVNGFASTNLMRAVRNIGVRRLLAIDFSTQIFGMCVTVLWARFSPSIWALVAGTLAAAGVKSIASHIPGILPGERNQLAWDKDAVHSLIHFGKWIFIGTGLYFFGTQADRIMLGKLVPFTVLGVYNIAFTIADIPRQVIQQFSYRVAFPFVAKLTKLPFPEFREQVLKLRFFVLCGGALVVSIVVNGGGWLVSVLYDKRYQDARWIVPILALGLWHTLLYSTTGDILFSLKKPKYNAIGTACFCITMFVALPIAFHYGGLLGAVITVAAGDFPFYIVLEIGAAREKVSLWRQDALATGVFLAFLTTGYFVQRLFH
jgi:O-antigen/teichoic acid export membrane protein